MNMPPVEFDLDAALLAAEDAADAAGEILRRHFRQAIAADVKADASPVTIADRHAEEAMRGILRKHFPKVGILGEEFGHERPEAEYCFVLDPLDGTRAYITGRPSFGILIGLLHGDRPLLGIIDQPILQERWVGLAGRKTRFTGPLGGVVGCRPCARLDQAELCATSPEMFGASLPRFQTLAGRARRNIWGGDCYGYGMLALGQADLVVECDLKPWDWAALVPVIEGAGGRVTDWAGRPMRRDGPGEIIAAGDPALIGQAMAALAA